MPLAGLVSVLAVRGWEMVVQLLYFTFTCSGILTDEPDTSMTNQSQPLVYGMRARFAIGQRISIHHLITFIHSIPQHF